jgi:predicted nucleic acid-binding protein
MVEYCFDTSVLIDILKKDEKIIDKINIISENDNLFITPISLCEIYKGIYLYTKGEKMEEELEDIHSLLETFNLIAFDKGSCKEFGKIFSYLRGKGNIIPDPDIMIASIVKANNLTLITSDKHFKNLGINVVIV